MVYHRQTKFIPKKGRLVGAVCGEQDEVLSESDKLINPITAMPKNDETSAGDMLQDEGNPEEDDDANDDEGILLGTGFKISSSRVKSPIKSRWLVPLSTEL